MSLKSWECGNCTNVLYRYIKGETYKYCKPIVNGTHKTELQGDYVECLNKTHDPEAMDESIRMVI